MWYFYVYAYRFTDIKILHPLRFFAQTYGLFLFIFFQFVVNLNSIWYSLYWKYVSTKWLHSKFNLWNSTQIYAVHWTLLKWIKKKVLLSFTVAWIPIWNLWLSETRSREIKTEKQKADQHQIKRENCIFLQSHFSHIHFPTTVTLSEKKKRSTNWKIRF